MSLLKKLGMSLASFSLPFVLNLEARLYARDIYVPRDYPTIQAGIDASEGGDRVLVCPGEYIINESITYRGKNITLKSKIGAEETIIRMNDPINPERASVVIFENGETEEAILEGFMITRGKGTLAPIDNPYSGSVGIICGGGIYCKDSSPTIKYVIVTDNSAVLGGGIACIQASPKILNNLISQNAARFDGGGIYIKSSQPIIRNNKIIKNIADHGGGIDSYDSRPFIEYNLISENTGITLGGGMDIGGRANISFNRIINNHAGDGWGAGGGIFCFGLEIIIENNIIARNSAYEVGGGIFCGGNWSRYNEIYIFRNTITENSSMHSGGIDWLGNGELFILNSIIWGNDLSGIELFQVFYSNISNNQFCGQNGNIDADPLFADPNNHDYHLKSQAGRWDPNTKQWVLDGETSPCIDAGDPSSPIMYEPFPNGGIINMGAYGGTLEASKSYFGEPLCETIVAGDINGDCKIDFRDFAFMAYHWLEDRSGE